MIISISLVKTKTVTVMDMVDINPNSKIPALIDTRTSPETRIFESGSILMYLAFNLLIQMVWKCSSC